MVPKTVKILSLFFLFCLYLCFYPTVTKAQSQSDAVTPGKKLIVGVLHDPPYIIKEKDGQWSGINVDIWKAVAQDLKVDYEFREMTFESLLEALVKKKIDLSIEAFFVLSERERQIDYASFLGYAKLGLAALPEKIQHPWWTAVAIVFSWGSLKIMGILFLCLCVLGFILWFVERKNNPDHFGGKMLKGIGSGIYWVGSTLASGVCFGVALKSFPARIIGLVWMFLCAIALSAMIASLTNAISENRAKVDTVADEQLRHMTLGGLNGSAETIALKKLGGKYKLYDKEEDALDGVLKGEIDGFLYDAITLHYYKDNDYKDKITVYQTDFKRYFFAFGLPRNSPLLKTINVSLLSLMEKPDWGFLLKRYGLEENFEEIQSSNTTTRKTKYQK
jgi:ABC-type amino acid transport substrate-binding protein